MNKYSSIYSVKYTLMFDHGLMPLDTTDPLDHVNNICMQLEYHRKYKTDNSFLSMIMDGSVSQFVSSGNKSRRHY